MTPEDGTIDAANLSGLELVRERIEQLVSDAVESHEHLETNSLTITRMFIVGSIGAGTGEKGSDLDIVVEFSYTGNAGGEYKWDEYIQHDIEEKLKQHRVYLASPLPPYIGYVDPTLGDKIDCEAFIRQMVQHGDYDRVYDVTHETTMRSDRF